MFQPIAVENLGAFSSSSSDFISALNHKISSVCVWRRKSNFILVPASVCGIATIQCSSSGRHLRVPGWSGPIAIPALFLFFNSWQLYTQGYKRKKAKQKNNNKILIIVVYETDLRFPEKSKRISKQKISCEIELFIWFRRLPNLVQLIVVLAMNVARIFNQTRPDQSRGSHREVDLNAMWCLDQRFSTFVTLWTPQKFQARVADPTAQGALASIFRTPGWARRCLKIAYPNDVNFTKC